MKIKPKKKLNHKVKVLCDYCGGFERQILEDHDHMEVRGETEDFMITSPRTKRTRRVCDNCIQKIQLEDQIIGLLDFHLKKL